ncbi:MULTISPECIES: SAM-dependent methyltransferase [Actinokineospora]|uniref:SAM-dependent methyltransferase n=1 Tax=Actinokineospora fastidiosa TaxID=1816 RepID=A0A918GJX0_9PSEU|nr:MULTISPECIES: methyltransferase domain-containing protein [Actinokineospora]UVS80867.1 Demethylrebeccamycin-D-glucose O-methyltransferase [Actinokineospora sp. UTMC 2448]GGS37795.1 SAM-dependent methyltransferase [Actinokineospora fastidiosa]
MTDLASLRLPAYPRSAAYDPMWMIEGCMGPNPLWLLEDLLADLPLRTGDRVLDLGCGQGLTSVFLAREYGVQVFACDLWVKPTDNLRRFTEAGVDDRVFPIHAEAHDLKFAKGYFDAAISVDAYQYFGTDDLYLPYLAPFVRKGGYIGVAVPGVRTEVVTPPPWLERYWEHDFAVFHTAEWWRTHWSRPGQVTVLSAREAPNAVENWRAWSLACAEHGKTEFVRRMSTETVEMLDADAGRTFAFPLVVART